MGGFFSLNLPFPTSSLAFPLTVSKPSVEIHGPTIGQILESTDVLEACGFSTEISPFSPFNIFLCLRGQMIELSGNRAKTCRCLTYCFITSPVPGMSVFQWWEGGGEKVCICVRAGRNTHLGRRLPWTWEGTGSAGALPTACRSTHPAPEPSETRLEPCLPVSTPL